MIGECVDGINADGVYPELFQIGDITVARIWLRETERKVSWIILGLKQNKTGTHGSVKVVGSGKSPAAVWVGN